MNSKSISKNVSFVTWGAIIIILALVPFHGFLTVSLSSLVGHYTAIRLWEEYLLLIVAIGTIYTLLVEPKIRAAILSRKIVWLIVSYLIVQLVWGLVAYQYHDVDKKALAYGLLIDSRYLIFFLCTWVAALKTDLLRNRSLRLVIYPALVVIVFGLLQIFVLPRNFLSHFGYNSNTIVPFETINHNSHYIRIQSTLRGANPLGAYLIIPLSLAAVLFVRFKKTLKKLIFLIAGFIVLIFSFSRSALLGAIVSTAFGSFHSLKSRMTKTRLVYVIIIGLLVLAGLLFAFRNNPRIQNITFHTQNHSAIKTTSDEGHSSALRRGIKDVIHDPLGRGPGTAGPASVYNNHPARISENYFVQIGQEMGWLGLILFLAINVVVGYLLWLKRADSLSLALLASLIGICIVNMLSHAWADETLAYLWWGLAGIAMVSRHKSKSAKI
jgi:hypothetical protein